MVILNQGRSILRDAIRDDFSSGQTGIGEYPPDESQTSLQSAVAVTLNTLSSPKAVSNETIAVTHVVTTAEANGLTLTEWEILGNSDATDYNRVVFSGLSKTAVIEVTMIQVFALERI